MGQVDRCDLPAGKEDTVVAVAIERSDGEPLADEGFRNSPELSLERDITSGRRDDPNRLADVILHLRNACRHSPWARPKAVGGDVHIEALVGSLQIIDHALGVEDAAAIGEITAAAFANAPHGSGTEARIVEALRRAGALTVSLVATSDDGRIVGHVAFSPVRIDGTAGRWYGLGPVSVAPELQRHDIGGALIREGLARLATMNADGCVVLGDPTYYGSFGFVSDPALTYGGEPSPYFQRLVLRGRAPKGDVSYHPAFDVE